MERPINSATHNLWNKWNRKSLHGGVHVYNCHPKNVRSWTKGRTQLDISIDDQLFLTQMYWKTFNDISWTVAEWNIGDDYSDRCTRGSRMVTSFCGFKLVTQHVIGKFISMQLAFLLKLQLKFRNSSSLLRFEQPQSHNTHNSAHQNPKSSTKACVYLLSISARLSANFFSSFLFNTFGK